MKQVVGLFIYKGFICCQSPKIFYTAGGKKMGNETGRPETDQETGEAADELIRQIHEDVFSLLFFHRPGLIGAS